jgi:ankyrin repeat protein
MLEVLLENHARDDIKDKNGFTPLAKAKYEGKEDLVKILQDYKKNPKKFYLKNEERQFDNKSTEGLKTIWVNDDNAKNDSPCLTCSSACCCISCSYVANAYASHCRIQYNSF